MKFDLPPENVVWDVIYRDGEWNGTFAWHGEHGVVTYMTYGGQPLPLMQPAALWQIEQTEEFQEAYRKNDIQAAIRLVLMQGRGMLHFLTPEDVEDMYDEQQGWRLNRR